MAPIKPRSHCRGQWSRRYAMAMVRMNNQWGDMMYASLRPKPNTKCITKSKPRKERASQRKRDFRPNHTPATNSSAMMLSMI